MWGLKLRGNPVGYMADATIYHITITCEYSDLVLAEKGKSAQENGSNIYTRPHATRLVLPDTRISIPRVQLPVLPRRVRPFL